MKKTVVLLALMLASPAYAQDSITTPPGDAGFTTPAGLPLEGEACWLGSMRFSPGASIRSAGQVMLCGMDFTWQPHDGDASGCIREGELHSVGDVQKLPNSATIVTCGADGTWTATTE